MNTVARNIESFLQNIIFSDIYITLGAVLFAFVNASILKIDVLAILPLFVTIGAATMFIYQFSRWTFFKNLENSVSKDNLYFWMERNQKFVLSFLFISIALGAISSLFIRLESIITLVILGVVSFLYNIEIPIGNGRKLTLRKIPFAKICMISFVWASMAVLMPWVETHGWIFHNSVWQLFLLQFVFIFIITLPFDINDVEVDKIEGVMTIPIYIGVKSSKILLTILSVFYLIFLHLWMRQYLDENIWFVLGIGILILSLLYKTLKWSNRAEKWEIMLWYDGSLILYFLIYILTSGLYIFE